VTVEASPEPIADDSEPLEEPAPPPDSANPMPLKLNQWRRSSFTGALVAGALLGLAEALEDRKPPEIVLTVDASGDDDENLKLDLDPYEPRDSTAVFKNQPATE
jgi:hypothetical protein